MEDTMAYELSAAWMKQDVSAVERLLQDEQVHVDVNYVGYFSENDDTLLLRAVSARAFRVVELLLARGADVNLENERLMTPLHAALSTHDQLTLPLVKLLVDHGADVCALDQEKEESPLHLAVKIDRVDIVRLLLDHDPSGIDQEDKRQRTPLSLALQKKRTNCILELLKRGATTSARSPLFVAVATADCTRYLNTVLRHSQRPIDVNEADEQGWTPLHHAAHERSSLAVKLLVTKNADPNRPAKDTLTPLHRAVFVSWDVDEDWFGWNPGKHIETVINLLACRKVDVNALTKDGKSALHYAVHVAWVECVELLLKFGAEVDPVDEGGETPLFAALRAVLPDETPDPVPCVTRLIDAGANVNVVNKKGATALITAIERDQESVVSTLLWSGANVNLADKNGVTALIRAIEEGKDNIVELLLAYDAEIDTVTIDLSLPHLHALAVMMRTARDPADCFVAIARSLCSRGAKWDASCDAQFTRKHDRDWWLGIRACVEHWANQFESGDKSLATIPVEIIMHGDKRVKDYLKRVANNPGQPLLRRCKICVVGPTEWGKTTLVKALTTGKKASVDPGRDGRTVGIDLQLFQFKDSGTPYKITFWDFAGQDEYQGAHSLFYSPRSLYVLCIDLEKYRDARKAFAKHSHGMETFMRDNIFRWVRAISARHKDAKFVAIGTKRDMVEDKDVTVIWKDLERRWKTWSGEDDSLVTLYKEKIAVNNYDTESVKKALEAIKSIVTQSPLAVGLTIDHTDVLEWIYTRRDEARALSDDERVSRAKWHPKRIQNELSQVSQRLKKSDDILELLHDLGDIYWLRSDRRDTIFIDPELLLEFAKEIITHNCDKDADEETKQNLERGLVSHKTLKAFPHWNCLDNELTFHLKCLLQQLRLAYPDKPGEMKWDSDLIVPAYWKRLNQKPSEGRLLRDRSVIAKHDVDVTVQYCLVYKIPSELSDVVFEQFAVQQRQYHKRKIWPNTIEDSFKTCVASATLERGEADINEGQAHNKKNRATSAEPTGHVQKLLDTIRLEVVGSIAVDAGVYLLVIFDAMEKVLADFKGVGVTRFLKNTENHEDHEWDDVLQKTDDLNSSSNSWMPPNLKEFFVDTDRRLLVRVEKIAGELFASHEVLKRIVSETNDNSWELLAKHNVLKNLVSTPDWQRKYPTQWRLTYDDNQRKVELEMLSHLKECFHDPIKFDKSEFLAKHNKLWQGCAWLITVAKKVVGVVILEEVVDKLVSDFKEKIEHSEKIDGIVRLLDLSRGGTTLAGEAVSEPVAAWFLHVLLKLHDPSFEVGKISVISKLEPKPNEEGILQWVPLSSPDSSSAPQSSCTIASSHDKSNDCDDQVQQPEEEDDSVSEASSPHDKPKVLGGQLRILKISGLSPSDEREVFCGWKLQEASDPTHSVCSGWTPRHLDKSRAPSWTEGNPLDNVVSYKQLARCNLIVEVKRPHAWPRTSVKDLYSGSAFLATHVGTENDGKPRRVRVDVEVTKNGETKQVPVSVQCELVFQ